jgi:hypothetical protein
MPIDEYKRHVEKIQARADELAALARKRLADLEKPVE